MIFAIGFVEEILVGGVASVPPVLVGCACAVVGRGLEGDRYCAGSGTWSSYSDRSGASLTLIEAEELEAVGLTGVDARRNLVTRGVRLNPVVGELFSVGLNRLRRYSTLRAVQLFESIDWSPVEALVHRGGLRADILSGGEIAIGDLVIAL